MATDDDTPQAPRRVGRKPGTARTGMRVQFRLDGGVDEAIIVKAARYTGLNVHAFIRSVAVQAARSIAKRHEVDGTRQHGFDVALFNSEFGLDKDTSSTKVHRRDNGKDTDAGDASGGE